MEKNLGDEELVEQMTLNIGYQYGHERVVRLARNTPHGPAKEKLVAWVAGVIDEKIGLPVLMEVTTEENAGTGSYTIAAERLATEKYRETGGGRGDEFWPGERTRSPKLVKEIKDNLAYSYKGRR